MIRNGGPIMLPIFGCSILLFIFVFERVISLRKGRVIPKPFVTRFLLQIQEGQLKPDEAIELCEQNQSPIAEVFAAAAKKWNRPSVEVEQAVLDTGERVANHLRKYLRLFNGISTVSPLLGLLGTVLGMISSFNTIASADAMGRADLLASGIGEALLTTAAGLCVAIPALIFYLYFVSRVDRLVIEIDALGQQMVNSIARFGRMEEEENQASQGRGIECHASKNPAR
jgi:biopolymer transport protein ExbB